MSDAHALHDNLPHFDERNVYHDGCPVCEERSSSGLAVFDRLDDANLERLLERAARIQREGFYPHWMSLCDQRVAELVGRLARLRPRLERLEADRHWRQ